MHQAMRQTRVVQKNRGWKGRARMPERVLVCRATSNHACPGSAEQNKPSAYKSSAAFAVLTHLNDPERLQAILESLEAAEAPADQANSESGLRRNKQARTCTCGTSGRLGVRQRTTNSSLIFCGKSTVPPDPSSSTQPASTDCLAEQASGDSCTPSRSTSDESGMCSRRIAKLHGSGRQVVNGSPNIKLASSPTTALRQLAELVAATGCLDIKEVLEAVEFVERVRKRVRRSCMLDLAAGHGLVGILFAAVERQVDKVLVVDRKQPKAFGILLEAVGQVAPWVTHSVTFHTADIFELERMIASTCPINEIQDAGPQLSTSFNSLVEALQGAAGTNSLGVTAVHACGRLTDSCLRIASALHAPVAAMPCCYTGTAKGTPLALRRLLGVDKAADVDRCYRLQSVGCYTVVDVASIPGSITPCNRILVAEVARAATSHD